ncbi:MAG: GNAT family N-acetyltransferase [Oscillospiraceae bacterium]|nr:GNAT family N-acetyltransferase [Oscillospiraceae bacterium]
MELLNKTIEYYSTLAGISTENFFTSDTPLFVRNSLLDKPLKGYGGPVDILIFHRDGKYIISYSQRGEGFLQIFEGNGIEQAIAAGGTKVKYYYNGNEAHSNNAVMLTEKDYPDYLDFFKSCNPGCGEVEWLHGYFSEIVQKGRCFGIYRNGKIAAATDSPDLPVSGEHFGENDCGENLTVKMDFAEIGINTLPEFRRQGLAYEVCAALISSLLSKGTIPLWSAASDNIASRKLAEKLGFKELMRVTEISLPLL